MSSALFRSPRHPAEFTLLLLLVLFVPLFEVPKNILIVLYALAWVWNRGRAGWTAHCGGEWDAWDTLFLVWLGSAYVFATFAGLSKNEWRGIGDLWRYIALAWLLKRSDYGEREWKSLYAAILVSTLVATAWGLAALTIPHKYEGIELHSVGHVNHSAAYIAISVGAVLSGLIAYWPRLTVPQRAGGVAGLAVLAVAIVLAASRAATVVTVGIVLMLAILWWRRSRAVLLAALVAVALFATTIETFDKDMRRKNELAMASANPVLNQRYPLWNRAWVAWRAHPWFGVGMDNFDEITAENVRRWTEQAGETYDPAEDKASTHAHSLYLTTLAERGLAGLAVVLAALGGWAVSLLRGWPREGDDALRWMAWGGAASALLATAAIGVVNTTLHHEHGLLAMMLLGIWLGAERMRRGRAEDPAN